jgi:MFS family permease
MSTSTLRQAENEQRSLSKNRNDGQGLDELQPQYTDLFWTAATCFQLVYSFVNTAMGLCILPTEADRLAQVNSSVQVGIYLFICGSTQLICPLAGKLSDRHSSRFGKRRPFLVGGTIAGIVSFAALREASITRSPNLYMVALFCVQFSLNVIYSAQCGLPADLLRGQETSGIVSGFLGLHCFLGSLAAVVSIMVTQSLPIQVQYICFMFSLVIACFVVCFTVTEESSLRTSESQESLSVSQVISTYRLDLETETDRDFFWVCVGRFFYYVSTSTVVFLMYYIRDMCDVDDEATLRLRLATLIVCAQIVGALITVPAGRVSNSVGRKPVIYAACGIMCFTFVFYVLAPFLPIAKRWPAVLTAGLSYGLGSGVYMSVDYALAFDCLPQGRTAAEMFGLWGVAGFFGSTFGPMIGGILLALSSEASAGATDIHSTDHYGWLGYALVMLILGCCMNIAVVIATSFIRGIR